MKTVIAQAISEIEALAGEQVVNHFTEVACVSRLASDMGIAVEKLTDSVWVARNQEQDGEKFDLYFFCAYGDKHTGQTVCACVLK